MALDKVEIETYQLELGEYYVVAGGNEDLESWHRIFLLGKPDNQGIQKRIELQFASDRYLENYISEGVGKVSGLRILIRYRISEFNQIYEILRSESPVFFEYDQFPSGSQDHMRVHTARITTSSEETGEGPADFSHP